MDKAVVKAFDLLEALSKSETPLGVTELATQSELGKSNVHRLLQTLQALGYVEKNESAHYTPTLKTWELGSAVISRLDIRQIAKPEMNALAKETGETIHLSELHDGEVLYIDKIESREPVRAYTQLGGRAPAYCTATGKIMLSYASDEVVKKCLSGATTFTDKTMTKNKEFQIEISSIKENRFAINRGEWRSDVLGAAAPVCNNRGEVCASIGISGPASRLSVVKLEAFAPVLLKHAHAVSRGLGCSEEAWLALS